MFTKTMTLTLCIGVGLLANCLLSGCGGSGENEDLDSFYGESSNTSSNEPSMNNGNQNSGSSGNGQTNVDPEMLAEAARKAAQHLNGMTAEYEGFFGSGQSSVQLKRTEEMYQLMEPISQRVSNSPAPPLEMAKKLRDDVLSQLLDALKRADLAELHFDREYNTSSFGISPFGNGGHEIGDGIRIARKIFDKIQTNIPVAERLTTGPPPTIGGPPPSNRSFGHLQSVSLKPSIYQSYRDRSTSGGMVPWKLRFDPPVEPYKIESETTLDIDAPKADVQPTTFYNPVTVLYPAMASTHVGLGLNEAKGNSRFVWSMEPRLRKGVVKGIQLQRSDIMALSADGQLFAGRPEDTSIIGLYDVQKRAPIGQIEHDFEAGGNPQLFFAAENRLVLMDGKVIHVWSTPGLKLEQQITLQSSGAFMSRSPGHDWSLSPGGRYLAVPGYPNFGNDIRFYDLTTGETAASISLTGYRHVRYVAAAYSKDGKKLAVLMEGPWNSWIQVWDIVAGRLTASYTIESNVGSEIKGDPKYQGASLEWFPDGERVLVYGKGVFDTVTGQGTKFITTTVRYPVKPIGENSIAVQVDKKLVAFDLDKIPENRVRWQAEKLKSETVAADNPFAVVPEGAKPTPLAPDRTNLQYISINDESVWNVPADPGPTQQSRSVSIPEFTSQHLYHADFNADQSRLVVGYSSQEPRVWNGAISGLDSMKTWVEYADLGASTSPTKFDLKFPSGLLAVSPSGQKLLTKDFDGLNRFDLWNLDSQKHLAGFIPYAQGRTDGGAPILWGDFIDEERVLTLSASQLTCWNSTNGAALYEIDLSNVAAWPVFSPGRQQLAVLHAGKLSIISTSDGQIIGHNPNLGMNGSLEAISYREDGQELAILSSPVGGGELGIVSIESGEVIKAFPIPLSGKVVEWCHNDYVLVDGAYCVSLEKNAVAWIYHLDGTRLKSGPGATKFFLMQTAYNSPQTLKSATIPSDETIAAVAAQDPPNDVVLTAGGNISMDIQVMSPPNHGNFNEEVRTAFASQFNSNEISVNASAPLTLVVRGSHDKTGDGISVGSFGPSFSNRSDIDEEQVTWTLAIKQENQTLWQRSISANNTGSIDLDDGVSGQAALNQAEQQLRANMWKKAANNLLNFKLPKYVFGPEAGSGLGSSKLGS